MEAQGRSSLSHCVVRFTALSRRQQELAELKLDHQRVLRDHETILALIDALAGTVLAARRTRQA